MNSRIHSLWFFCLVGTSFVIWWRPFNTVLRLATINGAYTYILLILPLTAGMICFSAEQIELSNQQGRVAGTVLLSADLLLAIAVRNVWTFSSDVCLFLAISTAVIWWVGSIVVCFGVQAFRRFLFPLSFLFLIAPFPVRAVNWIAYFLQHQSARATSILFQIAQVPVTRDGVLLSIPGLDIEVAHECSSIRSSMLLIVLTMFFAQLFLRSPWRKTLLILAAIPLSIAKNALRIFTIAELATRVNPGYLDGWPHRQGGIVFFTVAVVATGGLGWLLRLGDGNTKGGLKLGVSLKLQ